MAFYYGFLPFVLLQWLCGRCSTQNIYCRLQAVALVRKFWSFQFSALQRNARPGCLTNCGLLRPLISIAGNESLDLSPFEVNILKQKWIWQCNTWNTLRKNQIKFVNASLECIPPRVINKLLLHAASASWDLHFVSVRSSKCYVFMKSYDFRFFIIKHELGIFFRQTSDEV